MRHCRAISKFLHTSISWVTQPTTHLGRHSQYFIELRVFPKADEIKSTSRLCVNALNNCVNLQAVTWTRDGSLNDEIISTLATKRIRYLEFNAHAGSYYHPESLTRFGFLTTLFLLMPDRKTVNILPQWIRATGEHIRSITFLCKVYIPSIIHYGVIDKYSKQLSLPTNTWNKLPHVPLILSTSQSPTVPR